MNQYILVLHIRTIRHQNKRNYYVRHILYMNSKLCLNLKTVSTGSYNRIMYAPGVDLDIALLWHDLDLPKYCGSLIFASSVVPCDRENASVWYASLP